MRLPRLARRLWFHLAMFLAAGAACMAVVAWTDQRIDGERRRLVGQQTALTLALSSAFARIVDNRLDDVPSAQALRRDCLPCLLPLAPGSSLDGLRNELATLARSAAADAPVIALMSPGGELRGLRPDGAAFEGRLRRSSAAGLPPGPAVLDPFDLDDHPRTVAAAPLGSGLFLLLGLDLSDRLNRVDARRREDLLWAGATCALLVAVAAALSAAFELATRRQRRLRADRATLERLHRELTAAHARLSTQNADLEATFAAMTDGLAYYDAGLRLVRWNQQAVDLTGTPPGTMHPGIHVGEVMRAQALAGEFGPVPDPAALEADLARRLHAFRTVSPTRVTERLRPNGQVIELRRTMLAAGGNLTVYTDITDRHRADAAEKAAAEAALEAAERNADEKARFAAVVSHEVRTPLNVILASLALVDRDALDPGQRSLVDTGLQAGEALLALLNDVLDLSRLESGNLPITPASLQPRALVAGVAGMFRPIAARRGVRVDVAVDPGIPAQVVADAGRLRQILMNLVGNALKFSGPDRILLTVRTVLPPDGAFPGTGFLEFAVEDSGPAIPEADQARLFRPFSQLGRPAADTPGTGLGLAICATLATRMGGRMAVRTVATAPRPPANEFSVAVPLVLPPAGPDPSDTARRPPRTRILVVEDLAASRWLLATALRRDGHYVEVAASGADALARLDSVPFDVLLMDVSMPGMDGAEATRRVHAFPGAAGRTTVIGVTAFASEPERAALLAAGMAAVLPKPASLPTLRAAIYAHVWGGPAEPPGPATATTGPDVFDPSCLAGIPGAAALLQACLDDLAEQHAALVDAALCGNAARLRTLAHAMAGAAANHGLTLLARTLLPLATAQTVDGTATNLVSAAARSLDATRMAAATMLDDAGTGPAVVGATGIEPVTLRV